MITMSKNQAALIKPIIQGLVEQLGQELLTGGGNKPLTLRNSEFMMKIHLLREIYTKYYAELDMIKESYKMTWSPAQAICFWECSQVYFEVVHCHPVMNVFLYQLHQKLS